MDSPRFMFDYKSKSTRVVFYVLTTSSILFTNSVPFANPLFLQRAYAEEQVSQPKPEPPAVKSSQPKPEPPAAQSSQPKSEPSAAPKAPDMSAYMNGVKRKIQNVWRSPDVPRNCTVTLLFSVNKNGAVDSSSIKKSSGVASVDQLALQAIKKSSPFAKLPDGAGKFSVEYSFECGPHKTADAYLFNGVPIKNQEYKMSSGGSTLRNLDTDSNAERKLQARAAAIEEKADLLQRRLDELQKASPTDNTKLTSTMLELANAYKQLQQWEKAEGMYKALVAIEEKSPDQKRLVSALFEYGNMYFTMGKYVDAEPLLERSVALQNQIDAQHVNKQMLTEYAKTLYKLNKVAKADEVYKQLRSSQ